MSSPVYIAKMPEGDVLYRYDDGFLTCNGYGEPSLWSYTVVRRTPKGCWIEHGYGERFVLNDSRKRYAYPTVELAAASYLARKLRAVRLSQSTLMKQQEMLSHAKRLAAPHPVEEKP